MKQAAHFGFTLVEIIVVMGIVAVLLSFVTFDALNSARRVSVDSAVNLLISDLKQMQLSAMIGEGEVATNSGIYFDTTSYVLLPSNFRINLEPNLQFATPGATFMFQSGSGQIINFQGNNNSVEVINTTNGTKKTLRFNQYGVVYSLN